MQKFGLVRWPMIVTVGQNSLALLFPHKTKGSLHDKNPQKGLHHKLRIEPDWRLIDYLNFQCIREMQRDAYSARIFG